MSYDVELTDPVSGEVLLTDVPHQMKGGTYAAGGTQEMWINITYNYSPILYRVLGEGGIRSLYGKTGAETIQFIKKAAESLTDETGEDYWKPTEGNVKRALLQLGAMAAMRPDGIWRGD